VILFHYGESWNLLRADQRLIFAKSWPRASRYQQGHQDLFILRSDLPSQVFIRDKLMERRNRRTGRTEKARIWEVTDRTVRTWIGEAVAAAAADGVTFSVPVTPHTFRHSYAMHMLYAGIPLKVLQSLMGISPSVQRKSTRRFLRWMWLPGTGCSLRCRSLMRLRCWNNYP